MKKKSGFEIMAKLIGLVKPMAGHMIIAIIMGVIGNLLAAFITIFGGFAVLNVLGFETALSLPVIFVCAIVFAAVRALLRYLEQNRNHFIAFKLLALIRDRVFKALRKLSPAKLEGRDRGDLIAVITSDIELLEVFYAHTISPVAIAIIFTVVMVIFISRYSILLGMLALLAYIVVGLLIPLSVSKLSGDAGIRFRTGAGDLAAFVLDSLRGLSETIQYGNGAKRLVRMNEKTDGISKDEERLKRSEGRNGAVTNAVILVFDLAMLFVSVALYRSGAVGFDGVLIPTIAMMSSFGPTVALAALGTTLQNTFAAGRRVLDILEEKPVTEDITGKPEVNFTGAAASDVTFAYGEETILSGVSVDIPEKSIIGITGRSGSGKSTLLKLFMRFWKADGISVSGVPVGEINTSNLRDMESLVTQDTHLFHDSIKNNLRIAKLDASDAQIEAACRKAAVHDFIMTLPKGYDTEVGELGDTLSGGERQRIGLARAFLHDAPFMLLDEPTSNLDSLNEAVILKSLAEEKEDRTVVLVSHRESTMRIADKTVSVENGRIS